MATKGQFINGWSGAWGRLAVLGVVAAGTGFTAWTNHQMLMAQVQMKEGFSQTLRDYVRKDQWEERWKGHTLSQDALTASTVALDLSVKAFVLNAQSLSERITRLEGLLQGMQSSTSKRISVSTDEGIHGYPSP